MVTIQKRSVFGQARAHKPKRTFAARLAFALVVLFSALLLPQLVLGANAEEIRPDIAHGKALAELNCRRCHATDLEGESTHSLAPPFWSLSDRGAIDTLADMLVEKTSPTTSDMPHFSITKKQADDIAAWIAWVQPIAHGKRFAEQNCAGCHSIESTGKSPHKDAPPFLEIQDYYPLDGLEESFAEGIVTGHPDMPVFTLAPLQIADLIAFIESIAKP